MSRQIALINLSIIAAFALNAQNDTPKRGDRWLFLPPTIRVTDDPRRVPLPPGMSGPPGVIVLSGGRIFDGTGKPIADSTLVIERNKILRILPPASTDWPAGANVIDVKGKTVLPGLIDLHAHITFAQPGDSEGVAHSLADAALRGTEHLRYFVESGITSIRDVGSQGDAPFRLKAWVRENRIPGPRVFAAGQLITATGGHGDDGAYRSEDNVTGEYYVASGPDGWREAVRYQYKKGADVIKIASTFSRPEVSAAIEEAHSLGLKVTCDCETFYIQWAVEAGIDMIEHILPRTDATIRLMAQKGTESDPTLTVYNTRFDIYGGYFNAPSRRFTFSKEENFSLAEKIRKAGIKMGIGTDLVMDRFKFLPEPYIRELKLFVKLGDTNLQALQRATKVNAEMLDMGDKLGTLEPGKLADITVIDGRPDDDLSELAKVSMVIRDGYIQVKDGRIFIPSHVPMPMPKEKIPGVQ
jgi:imidazolonepropionase-like amidohydrolase